MIQRSILLLSLMALLSPSPRADTAVVFNELMYHPATNEPALEWVEFHNQLAVDVDISEWSVRGGINYTFPSNTIVRGRGFLVLASSPGTMTAAGATNVLGPFTGRLSNNGEDLELRNNSGRLVDSLPYRVDDPWPAGPDGAGVSLAKRDRDMPSAAVESWTASDRSGGTPSVENGLGAPLEPVAFNEVAAASNAVFWVELINYGTSQLSLADYVLARDGASNQEFVFPAGSSIQPGQRLVVTNNVLGFQVTAGDKLFLFTPGRAKFLDGLVIKPQSAARHPEAAGRWLPNLTPTPGNANAFPFRTELVINEIMYQQRIMPATATNKAAASPEAWIELHNRTGAPVDLTGWELTGGIQYRFSAGQIIPPNGYLVVADDAEYLRQLHPGIAIVGDFAGRLAGKSDLIILRDPTGLPADEVRYHDSGNWPLYANGGGSSLELRNPDADNSKAEAWAASDETNKTEWQTFTYRAFAAIPPGNGQPTRWNDFVFGLLSEGECLVDDIRVLEAPSSAAPIPMIANGDFEGGLAGWRVLGTHNKSKVIVDPANGTNHVLHLIATGAQEHMHNHIERSYNTGRAVANGREYEISFRARWLAGNNLLNTRLYFNRVPRSTPLPTPALSGTPGRRNSRYQPGFGPTFSQLQHHPVVPKVGEPVTVSVIAQHPSGVNSNELWWAVNSGPWNSALMTSQGGGLYAGTIPGQATNSVVQFYVRAQDAQGNFSVFPARGPDSGSLYAVEDGQANLPLAHNFRIILSAANTSLLHALTNVMSNDLLPCTIIYDERRAYYDCGVHLRGSERGRYSDVRTGFHVNFPPDDLFRGVHPVMLVDRSGAGDATANRQEEIVLKHIMNRAGGLPGTYPEICRVIAPRRAHTGPAQFFPRHEDVFVETAFENGGGGKMFEMELIYYPTTANAAGYKNPQPDEVIGTDLTNLGPDKEYYRYNFMIKNHRDEDDYSGLMAMGKAWSYTGATLDAQSRQIMDINQWMRAYALVSLCSVGDMYTFGNNHNFFTYQRPDGRFVYFPWDMDFAFTRGAQGALVGDQNLAKVVNLPNNIRLFYAHLLDIIGVSFNTNYMAYWTAHYARLAPGQNYAGSLSTINGRVSYVRTTLSRHVAAAFQLTSLTNGASNLAILRGTAPLAVQTIKVNGRAFPTSWAGVTNWTMNVPLQTGMNALEIAGYDLRGTIGTNYILHASIEYAGSLPDPAQSIVINEIMYNPAAPDSSYIELYNNSDFSFDLSGWRLNGVDYTFPAGSLITNRQFLTLASHLPSFNIAYGTNAPVPVGEFGGNLQNDGETLSLFRPGTRPGEEIVVDEVRYESASPWPTRPNGTGASLQLVDPALDNSRVGNWTDAADWRRASFTGVAGDGATNLQFSLTIPGEVLVDDVTLTESGSSNNLLGNGSFETGSLAPWSGVGGHTNSQVATGRARSGSYSLQLASPTAGAFNSMLSQTIPPLDPAKTYTLSFWYLPSDKGFALNYTLSPVFRSAAPVQFRLTTPGTANAGTRSLAPFPALWLTEVQAENTAGIVDGRGEREPWIEIYNAGATAIDLAGFYLAGNYTNLTQWAFPAGAAILPGQFKIIYADAEAGESSATEWHASFRLPPGQGQVALAWSPEGTPQILDYLSYSALASNLSYGAFPVGQGIHRGSFFKVTPGANNDNTAPPLRVFINEWMAANTQTLLNTNNNNRFDDWFELYNPADAPADLAGYFLTDNLQNKTQFAIPAGYVVPARGFLLVWADGQPELNSPNDPALHVNFRLERGGDAIGLFAGDGAQIDAVSFEPQFSDISQGRFADGASSIYFLRSPTPRGPNTSWANRHPVLSPIRNVTISANEMVRFTATATDPDEPAQTLTFSLDEGAPAGAVIDPRTGAFSWTPTAAQANLTNAITVRVTDNGVPPLSAARTFLANGYIYIDSIRRASDGQISITFGAIVGKGYRLEFKNNLSDPTWSIGMELAANSSSLTFTDQPGAQPRRFYRIVQVN